MNGFITIYYRYILSGLIIILMVLSFLLGVEEGRAKKGDNVVLSCSPEVLSSLDIQAKSEKRVSSNGADIEEGEILPETPTVLSDSIQAIQGKFLGSKNGTKYYTPDCSGVKRINPENYIWFSDEEDAQLQGYTPAKC